MNKKILVFTSVLLIAAGCNRQYNTVQNVEPIKTPTSTEAMNTKTYETDYFKVAIPEGWRIKQAVKKVIEGSIEKTLPNPAAVNITKGNYILYINTQASQVSGVEGGRFAEIAMGAPSADAVVISQPSPPCGTSDTNPSAPNHPRVDLFVSKTDILGKNWCAAPASGKNVWYFSYITNSQGSYFNYYNQGQALGYVITMAYNSKDLNSLPEKSSAQLNKALTEMTDIVKSLEIKKY
jgi:hypothetical protein